MKRYLVIVRHGYGLCGIANVSETNSLSSAKRNFTYWKRKYLPIFEGNEFEVKLIDRANGKSFNHHYMKSNRGN